MVRDNKEELMRILTLLIDKYEHNDTAVKELAGEMAILAKELKTTIEFTKLSDVNCIKDLLANVLNVSVGDDK